MAKYFYKKSAIIVIVLLTVYLIIWNSFIYSFTRKKNLRNEFDTNQLVVKGVVINTLENYLPSHYEQHYFNSAISDSISTDRRLDDTRNPRCKGTKYSKEDFGKTSVIISYHNEAISTLLRTITSIINRTPTYLLEEIILIDDCSTENYSSMLEVLPKVKLYRNEIREGLIRSRNRAAKLSVGEFLFFLDSHCEVNISWLEPLLQEVISNPGAAVSPVIDNINGNTFEYKGSFDKLKGGFDWNLQFKWIAMSEEEKDHRILYENDILPYMTPTTSGGIFLISRKWFFELEGFNSALEIWGGESLELSLKIWLCGGQIEIAPCSRVGHIFRDKYPYDFPRGILENHLRNSKIIVENWFDDYKYFFYSTHTSARNIQVDHENTQSFKDKMQCRHFSWYIHNIFPELKLPNEKYLAYGQLQHGSLCLDIYPHAKRKPLQLNECSKTQKTKWVLDVDNILSTENGACLNVEENHLKIEYCKLSKNQKWHRSGGNLIHTHSGKCLENLIRSSVGVSNCRKGALSQLWSFSIEMEHY